MLITFRVLPPNANFFYSSGTVIIDRVASPRVCVNVNYRFRKRERVERTSSLFMTRDTRPVSLQHRTFIRVTVTTIGSKSQSRLTWA